MTLQSLFENEAIAGVVESTSTAAADRSAAMAAVVDKTTTKQQPHEPEHHRQNRDNSDASCCSSTAKKTTTVNNNNNNNNEEEANATTSTAATASSSITMMVRDGVRREICRQVVRSKLAKRRHLVVKECIRAAYLRDTVFPALLQQFAPQRVRYNGGVAGVTDWKISCYLEVMEGGVPTAQPHAALLRVFAPLLEQCDALFLHWYRQQHACNNNNQTQSQRLGLKTTTKQVERCRRLMTFVTRYTPAPGEQALLKHVDGAGKVDGSCVVALPTEAGQEFEGGGLTFWDGRRRDENSGNLLTKQPDEIHYDTRAGDLAFIDRAVWHQADPITKGTRWALVIFYKVE